MESKFITEGPDTSSTTALSVDDMVGILHLKANRCYPIEKIAAGISAITGSVGLMSGILAVGGLGNTILSTAAGQGGPGLAGVATASIVGVAVAVGAYIVSTVADRHADAKMKERSGLEDRARKLATDHYFKERHAEIEARDEARVAEELNRKAVPTARIDLKPK